MKLKDKNIIASYSDADVWENEFNHIKENWQDNFDEEPTDEEINNFLENDNDMYMIGWENFLDNLSYEMEKINKSIYWRDTAKNMGWRNLSGYKEFEAKTPRELLEAITPNTQDYSIYFYKGGKTFFYAKISHHDAPMGETHRIQAISKNTFNKNNL